MGRDETFSQRVTPRDLELMVIEQAQAVADTATMTSGFDATTEDAVKQLCDAVHDLNRLHAYGGPRADMLPGGLA